MRLSDLLKDSGDVLDDKGQQVPKEEKKDVSPVAEPAQEPAEEAPREIVPPPVQRPPSTMSEPSEKEAPEGITVETEASASFYNSMPEAMLRAAEQLDIPIPQDQEEIVRSARQNLALIMKKAVQPNESKEGLWKKVRDIANDLAMVLALDANLARVISRHGPEDEQLSSHSINSALIAMDLVKDIENAEFLPQEIGAAALLHDIGVEAMGLSIEYDEEKPVFKDHVERGVQVLKEMKVPDSILTMVKQHHERIDGEGYPEGISGGALLRSSQILGLSEGFERIMGRSAPDEDGEQQNYVQTTVAEFRKAYKPDILKAFISLRGFYPNGTMVELTNRSICLVVKQNEGFPLRPVVQVIIDNAGNHPDKALIKDLRTSNTLSIVRAVTQGK